MFVGFSYAPGQKPLNSLQDQRHVSFVLTPVSFKCWRIDGTSFRHTQFKYLYFGGTQFLNAYKMKGKIVPVLN
jgi:hypothetical protein